ncbi:penicillin-binding protein 2 [Mucilaginibacter humi]|uniref:hypothetical protein n=1 Tax=Mucilaginibacter humi TaxID=2732510 RepID=UPI001FEA86A5|nr:hypothetical protein [Mucilaginibacter humi]
MNQFFERRYVIGGIFITIILILLARLFYIQIIDDRYALYANKNVIRPIIQYPARGPILDRNGKVLVSNDLVYDITVIPKEVKPFDTLEFCKLIGIDKPEFDKRFAKAIKYSPNLSSPFEKQLSPQLTASLQERLSEFRGFSVQPHPIRTYPDSVAAQFLGYIGEASPDKIAKSGGYYHLGDYIGISGVEKSYEEVLRGQRGVQNMMVDSRGIQKGSYANGAYDTPGCTRRALNIIIRPKASKAGRKINEKQSRQYCSYRAINRRDPAFVSSPGYDPNALVGHERGANYNRLHDNPYKPFLIRPIRANYPRDHHLNRLVH